MAFTASQYLFKPSTFTATTTATQGAYTVPASTRFSIIAMTLANTATTNKITFVDVSLFDGATAYPILTRAPLYPGGALIVEGIQKHTLPTSGAVYVTPYATIVTGVMTGVEIT